MNIANQNPPTIGGLAVAFWTSLIYWAATEVNGPTEVEATGAAFLIGLGVLIIGRITQKFTNPIVGPH